MTDDLPIGADAARGSRRAPRDAKICCWIFTILVSVHALSFVAAWLIPAAVSEALCGLIVDEAKGTHYIRDVPFAPLTIAPLNCWSFGNCCTGPCRKGVDKIQAYFQSAVAVVFRGGHRCMTHAKWFLESRLPRR